MLRVAAKALAKAAAAKAKGKARPKPKAGPKRAAKARGRRDRRRRGGEVCAEAGGVDPEFNQEDFLKGAEVAPLAVPLKEWRKGLKLVLVEATYWEEKVQVSGVLERIEFDGDSVAAFVDALGTTGESLVRWKGKFPGKLLEVHFCHKDCGKVSKDGLVHCEKLKLLKRRRGAMDEESIRNGSSSRRGRARRVEEEVWRGRTGSRSSEKERRKWELFRKRGEQQRKEGKEKEEEKEERGEKGFEGEEEDQWNQGLSRGFRVHRVGSRSRGKKESGEEGEKVGKEEREAVNFFQREQDIRGQQLLNNVWPVMTSLVNEPPVVRKALPPNVKLEFLRFLQPIPLAQMNLRLGFSEDVTASDASEFGGGFCVSKQHAAHCSIRGDLPEVDDHCQVLRIGLFGALRVAADVLLLPMAGHLSSEVSPEASRVLESHFPDCSSVGPVQDITEEMVVGWACKYSNVAVVVVAGGPPCQGVSGLNADRKGALRDARSSLFPHLRRVHLLCKRHFPWAQVHYLMESVFSMDEKDRQVMSQSIGSSPWLIDSLGVALCRRPRLYWVSWELQGGEGVDITPMVKSS